MAPLGTCLAAGSYLWVSWKQIWAKEMGEGLEFQILPAEAEGGWEQFCFRDSVFWTCLCARSGVLAPKEFSRHTSEQGRASHDAGA